MSLLRFAGLRIVVAKLADRTPLQQCGVHDIFHRNHEDDQADVAGSDAK